MTAVERFCPLMSGVNGASGPLELVVCLREQCAAWETRYSRCCFVRPEEQVRIRASSHDPALVD